MAGGYERVCAAGNRFALGSIADIISQVNAHDDDFADSPTEPLPRPTHPIPNSPPPSFRSRASSRERNQRVNPDLEDAFDDDSDESDDEGDDRQRLVRGNSSAGTGGATPNDAASSRSSQTPGTTARTTSTPATATGSVPPSGRVYGGGIQSDGVFSNLAAKPDLGGEEKEELPPVCFPGNIDDAHEVANSLAVIRGGRCRSSPTILGDHALRPRSWDARRCLH